MSYEIGQFAGALIPTFSVSRLLLWIMRGWSGGDARPLVAHGGTLLITGFLAGMGMADGGAFAGMQAVLLYAPACILWWVVDRIRMEMKRAKARSSQSLSPPQ